MNGVDPVLKGIWASASGIGLVLLENIGSNMGRVNADELCLIFQSSLIG